MNQPSQCEIILMTDLSRFLSFQKKKKENLYLEIVELQGHEQGK
jgi:hypothetical protein